MGKGERGPSILILTWASGKWSKFEEKNVFKDSYPDLLFSIENFEQEFGLSQRKKPLSVIRYTLELRMHWFNEFMNPIKDIYNPQNLRGSIQTIHTTEIPNSSSNTVVLTLSGLKLRVNWYSFHYRT